MILADESGEVQMQEFGLSAATGIPRKVIAAGLDFLKKPADSRLKVHQSGYIRDPGYGFEIVGYAQMVRQGRPASAEWKRISGQVFKRDDYTCVYCFTRGGDLHCDHVVPISRGGSSDIDNLANARAKCNMSKGSKLMSEWRSPI